MFAFLQQYCDLLYFPPDFFFELEYTVNTGQVTMPSRTDTIRRCAFKLPRNDKYQCQKAGDRYQLNIELWYCRFHDRHAQNRCEVLVEWAGKGAQCDQLGHLDKDSGKKLCEWHAWKSKGDGWQDAPLKKRKDTMLTICSEELEAGRQEIVKQEQSADVTKSPSSPPEDELSGAPDPEKIVEQPACAPSMENLPRCIDSQDQTSIATSRRDSAVEEGQSPADTKKLKEPASIVSSNNDLSAADLSGTTELAEESPVVTPILSLHSVGEPEAITPTTPSEEVNKFTTATAPNERCNGGRSPHTRVDSLDPLTAFNLVDKGSEVFAPTPTVHAAYREVVQSLTSPKVLQGVPSPRRALQARIDFLNAQDASSTIRNAAIYVQCCVCLERHGEYNMRQVNSCKHQYRDLCFRKATRMGSLRRFNCSSCRVWMAERQSGIVDNGYDQLRKAPLP
jgi:hypothetical protein